MAAQHAGIWQENEPRLYKPLVDEPDLFLKFARFVEEGPVTEQVMFEWVRSYGVLGLGRPAGAEGMGNSRGGQRENVLIFGEPGKRTVSRWNAARDYTHKRTILTGKDGDSCHYSAQCICRWQALFPRQESCACAGRRDASKSSVLRNPNPTWTLRGRWSVRGNRARTR